MSGEDVFGIVGTTQAGNFHVERVVAEGGFGVVYRALHGGFRAPVALKCLKIPDEMTTEERDSFLEKFREEAELTFRLSAAISEVCRPLHVDVLLLSDGRFVPFLAMEWLEGESLDSVVSKRRKQGLPPLGLHKVVKMMRPVATALAKAHRFPGPDGAVAITHRDLKPENLILASVGGSDSMKILDFGIAKAKRAASQAAGRATGRSIAEEEAASFTPAYGAPEQWAPKTWGETGPWTDVWGLAITMAEALCGKPPIDGEPWMMRRICLDEKRRPTPKSCGADIPDNVDKVFEQALAVDPRKRFKTIEAFWSELERSIGMQPTLGPRDDRREPEESRSSSRGDLSVIDAALPSSRDAGLPSSRRRGAAAPVEEAPPKGERIARIELQKKPAPAPAPPPSKSASVPLPSPAPSPSPMPGPAPSEPWESSRAVSYSQSGEERLASAPSMPAISAVQAMSAPGSLEFDLGPPMSAAPPTPQAPVPAPSRPARADAAPPRRRASLDLELPLPSASMSAMPAVVPPSLEMSLPVTDTTGVEEPLTAGPDEPPPPVDAFQNRSRSGAFARESRASIPPEASPGPTSAIAPGPPSRSTTGTHAAPQEITVDYARAGDRATTAAHRIAARMPERDAPNAGAPGRSLAVSSSASGAALPLRDRLRVPLGILVFAVVLASLDPLIHRITGDHLPLPVELIWIAGPLALVGVGLVVWRIMEEHADG